MRPCSCRQPDRCRGTDDSVHAPHRARPSCDRPLVVVQHGPEETCGLGVQRECGPAAPEEVDPGQPECPPLSGPPAPADLSADPLPEFVLRAPECSSVDRDHEPEVVREEIALDSRARELPVRQGADELDRLLGPGRDLLTHPAVAGLRVGRPAESPRRRAKPASDPFGVVEQHGAAPGRYDSADSGRGDELPPRAEWGRMRDVHEERGPPQRLRPVTVAERPEVDVRGSVRVPPGPAPYQHDRSRSPAHQPRGDRVGHRASLAPLGGRRRRVLTGPRPPGRSTPLRGRHSSPVGQSPGQPAHDLAGTAGLGPPLSAGSTDRSDGSVRPVRTPYRAGSGARSRARCSTPWTTG